MLDFDPKKAVVSLVKSQRDTPGRKLSFFDQCAAFYSLYKGVASHIVAKTFGISQTAASQIGGCLQTDPRPYAYETVPEKIKTAIHDTNGRVIGYSLDSTGQTYERPRHRDMNRNRAPNRIQRYRRIAEEFTRLGEEAFAEKYFTDAVFTRLQQVKHDVDGAAAARERSGPDPTADEGPSEDTFDGQTVYYRYLEEPAPAGWYIIGPNASFGREHAEGGERRPFKRKSHARKAAWFMMTGEEL